MRRLGPLAGALLSLTWMGCEDLRDSAARVEVRTTDFRPGCVRLVVTDAEDADHEQVIELDPPSARSASWVVAVYRGRGWSRSLQIDAVIFEQSCNGNEVDRERAQVTLTRNQLSEVTLALTAADGDEDGFAAPVSGGSDCNDAAAAIHPGATEVCDGVDQNCDAALDETFGVGTLCAAEDACPGVQVCAADGGVRCELPATNEYFPDSDGDGYGAQDAGTVTVCGAFGPDAGMAAAADDCDDRSALTYFNAPERCDGVDNSCNGETDEIFALGAACDPGNGECEGQLQCDGDGGTFCKSSGPPLSVYLDDDFDGHGEGSAIGETCGEPDAGESVLADDCNDANRRVFTGAPELCDLTDNDCDFSVDEGGVCAQTADFYDRSSGGGQHDWKAVDAWRDGGTGVFIVGAGDRIRAAAPGGAISDRNGHCVSVNWEGVWVDPRTSLGYLAGRAASLAVHPAYNNNCTVTDAGTALDPLSSIVGYQEPNGVLLFAVAENGNSVVWDGGTSVRALPQTSPASCLEKVHGIGPEVQFAVGGTTCDPATSLPVIFRWEPQLDTWSSVPVPATFIAGKLHSVYVVTPRLAYAVGTTGSAPLMAIWDGDSWSEHTAPAGSTSLTGVTASGRQSIAVSGDSSVWFYNGSWTPPMDTDNDPMREIGASGSDDIWVVGDNGSIKHWSN